MTLGQRIREIRLERGETMGEFGKHFGTSDSIVSRWERDLTKPRADRLKSIADLAGATVEELAKDNCAWQVQPLNQEFGYYPIDTCRGEIGTINLDFYKKDYKFCPYCGKEIIIKE
ncbi:helix-turn-helix domain-containing protein [Hutsoniella sourekii]|uniref:helix-turn-helix domain-containing protein n=1 Tax=Hutsoniella sourekii TaxID=87650 RepID=UPI000A05AC24|nr:helix-turn-helix transcriptional regulator [Hutsoniella sourekii]